jgi:hypothetical protein
VQAKHDCGYRGYVSDDGRLLVAEISLMKKNVSTSLNPCAKSWFKPMTYFIKDENHRV